MSVSKSWGDAKPAPELPTLPAAPRSWERGTLTHCGTELRFVTAHSLRETARGACRCLARISPAQQLTQTAPHCQVSGTVPQIQGGKGWGGCWGAQQSQSVWAH